MVLAELWVIVKPNNKGIFPETFASSADEAWDEFILGGICEDAIDEKVDLHKKGYRARKVKIIFE